MNPYSDLDLLLHGQKPISLSTLGKLAEAFAESNLPFKVELVDWHRITDEFRQHIMTEAVELNLS